MAISSAVAVAMANISLATMAAAAVTGGAMSVAGSVQQHNQAKANAQMQSDQLEYNQRLEQREADAIEAETAENARRQREESSRLMASQRAMLGKSGALMTTGTPLAILGATASAEELTVRDIHRQGYGAAAQHRAQANLYGWQARAARASAPSGASLGMTIAGNMANTAGSLGNIGMNYGMFNAQYNAKNAPKTGK